MNKLTHVIIIFSAFLVFTASANAAAPEWTPKDVSEAAEKVKTGKPLYMQKAVPADQAQVIDISVNTNMGQAILYRIDLRAKLCFVYRDTLIPVSCKAIKEGYPIFAPIIDWEK